MKALKKNLQNLKHGDPHAVALTAVLAFLISVCWFAWVRLGPESKGGLTFRKPQALQLAPTPTPLSAFVLRQRDLNPGENPPNPFFLRYNPPATPTPPPAPPTPTPTPRPNSGTGNTVKDPANGEPRPPRATPPPAAEVVTLIYRGVMVQPDGSSLALVADAKSGGSHFLKLNATLHHLTITSADKLELVCVDEAGEPVTLRRGEPYSFTRKP